MRWEGLKCPKPKVLSPSMLGRKHGHGFGWWQFSRCENSAAQRGAGAAESFVCPRFGHAPSARCAGRQSRSATLSTSHAVSPSFLQSKSLVQSPSMLGRKHGQGFGWWQFSRCENSAAQRRGGGIIRVPKVWPCAKCPLRGQTESQRNSVHQPCRITIFSTEQVLSPKSKQKMASVGEVLAVLFFDIWFCDPCWVRDISGRYRGCRCAQPPANVWHPFGMRQTRGKRMRRQGRGVAQERATSPRKFRRPCATLGGGVAAARPLPPPPPAHEGDPNYAGRQSSGTG